MAFVRVIPVLKRFVEANRALVRTWRGRFIAVFVLAQLALPLRYYIDHRDPHDERFAWRMFSPIRMTQCQPKFVLDGKPVDLYAQFHEAWNKIAERGRFGVVEAMGKRICDEHPGSSLEVTLECRYVDDSRRTWGGYNMCNVPEL